MPATGTEARTTEIGYTRAKTCLLYTSGIESERNDLRRRLDAESEARENAAAEIRRLTLMLTHSQKIEPEAQPAPTANQNDHLAPVRPWLWVCLLYTSRCV